MTLPADHGDDEARTEQVESEGSRDAPKSLSDHPGDMGAVAWRWRYDGDGRKVSWVHTGQPRQSVPASPGNCAIIVEPLYLHPAPLDPARREEIAVMRRTLEFANYLADAVDEFHAFMGTPKAETDHDAHRDHFRALKSAAYEFKKRTARQALAVLPVRGEPGSSRAEIAAQGTKALGSDKPLADGEG